jgi:hypothetical protein
MSDTVTITRYNAVHDRILCDPGIAQEISEYFTFMVPGHQHMPLFKSKLWDGKIRLFNTLTHLLYGGLRKRLEVFCQNNGYILDIESDITERQFSPQDAANFIDSLNLPSWVQKRDYQYMAVLKAVRKRRILLLSPTNCHKVGDQVFSSTGWVNIENIQIGDQVYGNDGTLKTVINTVSGRDELFEVQPKGNRSSITVTKDHILPLQFVDSCDQYSYGKGDREYIDEITVEQYNQESNSYKRVSSLIYNSIPLQSNNVIPNCDLDPYFIGIYLGDGHVHNCEITTNDQEIVDALTTQATKLNCSIVNHRRIQYKINSGKGHRNRIFAEFDKIGIQFGNVSPRITCRTKFIPSELFDTSVSYRYQLLAGLLDSDGWLAIHSSHFEFTSKSARLCDDVHRLAISLGLVAHRRSFINKKHNTIYYRTWIQGSIELIPTRLERKKAVPYNKKHKYNKGFDVTSVGIQDYYGITVEGHYYITSDGMITHNSGKTLISYILAKYHADKQCLLIVPDTGLVAQTADAMVKYGYEPDQVHRIFSGQDKGRNVPLTVSTWQSIQKLPRQWFDKFQVVFGDEAHTFQAKSLKGIMEKMVVAEDRIAMTGSLDGQKTNELTIEGLFGPVHRTTTNREMIDKGYSSELTIKIMMLTYDTEARKLLKGAEYHAEIDYLVGLEKRNQFIINLALSLKGNTLITYKLVDKHGKPLYEDICRRVGDTRKVYLINKDVPGAARIEIARIVNEESDAIIVASSKTFATGIDLPNLNNLILAAPSKSKIVLLQSLGRTLRVSKTKNTCEVFDIVDDIEYKTKSGNSKPNHTLRHFADRLKLYYEEQFKPKIFRIQI